MARCPPVVEVLHGQKDYKDWRSRMETYLSIEGLLDVVKKPETKPTSEFDVKYKAWEEKNLKALYAIKNSCGHEVFECVRRAEDARSAWRTLEMTCTVPIAYVDLDHQYLLDGFNKYVSDGDWDRALESLGEVDVRDVLAVKSVDSLRCLPLHIAARKGHSYIVKEMVALMKDRLTDMKNWADPFFMLDSEGFTPLHIAVKEGHIDVVKELGSTSVGNVRDKNGDTALHLAVKSGDAHMVNELLQSMAKDSWSMTAAIDKRFTIKNREGFTAFHLAIHQGNARIVREFLSANKGVNVESSGKALLKRADRVVGEVAEEVSNFGHKAANAFSDFIGDLPRTRKSDEAEHNREDEKKTPSTHVDYMRRMSFKTHLRNGDWDKAEEYLREVDDPYMDIIRPVAASGTALHVAAEEGQEGNVGVVKGLLKWLKEKEEDLELKTFEDFKTFGSGVKFDAGDEIVMESAKKMVDQYEQTVAAILEIQGSLEKTALHHAARRGQLDIVKELAPLMSKRGLELKDNLKHTALLIAVREGHLPIVKVLASLMRPEALEERWVWDGVSYTVLGEAFDRKDEYIMELAKCIAAKNKNVFGIPTTPYDEIPLVWALRESKWDLAGYFYSVTPTEALNGANGSAFICYSLESNKMMDRAWRLLRQRPELAYTEFGKDGHYPMMYLVYLHTAFLSGTRLTRWQRWIYNCINIQAPASTCDISVSVDEPEDDKKMESKSSVIRSLYKKILEGVYRLLEYRLIYEIKLRHQWTHEFLQLMGEVTLQDKYNKDLEADDKVKEAIFRAMELGHFEFVTHLCKANKELLNLEDERGKGIFHFAIENRLVEVYNLVYKLDTKQRTKIGISLVAGDTNLLHHAANLSSPPELDHILDASLQMQRELQWFKEVESFVPREMHERRNHLDNLTGRELFSKNHKKLLEDAESSIKGTASSCSTVGALIVTMMFAGAFTFPGGNDGSEGYPLLVAKNLFMVFIVSDIISLASSTTSVITFLGILTSRYAEDDFLKYLPTKMMIGLVMLFFAIATMMIAFSCAFIIMLKGVPWIVILTIMFGSVPIMSFVWLLFPLLVQIFTSTYGRGIFYRKVES